MIHRRVLPINTAGTVVVGLKFIGQASHHRPVRFIVPNVNAIFIKREVYADWKSITLWAVTLGTRGALLTTVVDTIDLNPIPRHINYRCTMVTL